MPRRIDLGSLLWTEFMPGFGPVEDGLRRPMPGRDGSSRNTRDLMGIYGDLKVFQLFSLIKILFIFEISMI